MTDHPPRTSQQRKAIEVFCKNVAQVLNDGGLSVQVMLKSDVEVPWSQALVKEIMWKGIQEAMFNKKSTTELDTSEVTQIYEVFNRHMAEHEVFVEFPSNDILSRRKE